MNGLAELTKNKTDIVITVSFGGEYTVELLISGENLITLSPQDACMRYFVPIWARMQQKAKESV